jgi:hypothetical protein
MRLIIEPSIAAGLVAVLDEHPVAFYGLTSSGVDNTRPPSDIRNAQSAMAIVTTTTTSELSPYQALNSYVSRVCSVNQPTAPIPPAPEVRTEASRAQ